MNRAERRQQARRNKEYDRRQTFTKRELEVMNEECYKLGVKHTVQAMCEEFGIGPVRLARFSERLKEIERKAFTELVKEVTGENNG